MNRRKFLVGTAAAIAAAPFVTSGLNSASGAAVSNPGKAATVSGRRKLGSLEVSSVGLGVQNMHRTYQTTVPSRPEMINIIRAAYDHGVTFFDTLRLMDPSRTNASSVKPQSRSATRLLSPQSWLNIDQETGKRLPGLNSKPEHIRIVVDGSLKRLRTDRIDLLYQHRVDPKSR
jgi:aryl-alcohol dehydrogenase-like predicted oxidoreductase